MTTSPRGPRVESCPICNTWLYRQRYRHFRHSLVRGAIHGNTVHAQSCQLNRVGVFLAFCCSLSVFSPHRYEGGRFVMRKKSIQAKELKRVARERVAARLVYGDKEKPPPSLDKA